MVDDHPVFRLGMVALLSSLAAIDVVGEAGSLQEAHALIGELLPDVVVMDLQLPDGSGITGTHDVVRAHPAIAVLVVTMLDDDDAVFAAMRAGARGYLVKGAGPVEIERAVRAVGGGEVILGQAVARRAAGLFAARSSAAAFPALTAREHEVLDLLARGLDNHVIARRLDVNEKTVRNHVSNVFVKLQVPDRPRAIVKAREAGMGQD